MNDLRYQQLYLWLQQQLPSILSVKPLAGDASFRRYFRVHLPNDSTYIAMDAPPDKEDCKAFIAIANILAKQGLKVPKIIAQDLAQGFLLLSDLGDDLYFKKLNSETADRLYKNAIEQLIILQHIQPTASWQYPLFQPLITEELARFREWYLLKHLNLTLTQSEELLLAKTFEQLANIAQQQPHLCVHRDYHSRNLLVLPNNGVGILDFQDAVWGPATYDLVSLIRDCYINWPHADVQQWALYYYDLAKEEKIFTNISTEQFLIYFDWMGMQRHLKAIYIFARKFRRDGSTAYLGDIPRTLDYILHASSNYQQLTEFRDLLINRVLPHESNDSSSRARQTLTSTD